MYAIRSYYGRLSVDSAEASEEAPSRAFLRALEEGEAHWSGEGKNWRWTSKPR